MKCNTIPILRRKFFLNILNNGEYVNNYCNGPLNHFDKHYREWYF